MGGSILHSCWETFYNWKVQHNVLHHTYTNIHGHDEDLDAGRVLRFFATYRMGNVTINFNTFYSVFAFTDY